MDQGVTLSTVGFGMDNFNDVLMEQIANDHADVTEFVFPVSQAEGIQQQR